MRVTVARIGRAHGLRGEVSVELRTDIPEDRLIPGEAYETEPAEAGPLTIARVRVQSGRWYVQFEEIGDRTAAENARGIELVLDADESDEEDAWFVQELVGLEAVRPDGTVLGTVVDLMSMPAQDLLVVKQPGGSRAMIPFVEEFVPEVDLEGGRVVLTPPYGLLAGEEPESTGETAGD
ncbi:ribosome maturation factor RimM [Demequina pelophila]|uniref:ribosome maturation factor RimM n=1 Tax=Demequina pelophila TaxID=1638984 RepID=UPI000783B5E3|nr:ribosome maturation factor RimM [Demequina pelophila]